MFIIEDIKNMKNNKKNKRIAIATLGCKVNQYDSEALKELLREDGHAIVPFSAKAEIYIVNSCAVTDAAITKSRRKINQAKTKNPKAKIILSGCWPQTGAEALPEVSIISGTKDRKKILAAIADYTEPTKQISPYESCEKFEELKIAKFGDRSRAIVKIQDGCRQFCSYCIIPYARGPLRSRNKKEIMLQVAKLVKSGYKEIVLTGIHLGLYGAGTKEPALAGLIKDLVKIKGLERVRLSSIEVNEISEELIKLTKENKKLCPHLHIPLQNGSDKILMAMNRPYDTKKFEEKIKKIRAKIPEISLTTDVIVGFPGETEKDFKETCEFCEKINFSKIHVFSFSRRKGTPAYEMLGQIDKETITKRSGRLRLLSDKLENNYAKKFIGKTVEVLPQGKTKDGRYTFGLTDNYLRINFDGKNSKEPTRVRIEKISGNTLIGKVTA